MTAIVVILIIAIVIAETMAESMLFGELPRPVKSSANLYLNLCEVNNRLLEVLDNAMTRLRWRCELEHAKTTMELVITIAVLLTALVLSLLLG